jgi:hypothetical protein
MVGLPNTHEKDIKEDTGRSVSWFQRAGSEVETYF